MKKSSALAAGLKAAAGHSQSTARQTPGKEEGKGWVTIAAHYDPSVRRVLKQIGAEHGRTLRQLLGEAINDVCAKYGKPEPYRDDGTGL